MGGVLIVIVTGWLLINYFVLFFPGVLFRQLRWASSQDQLPLVPLLWLTFFSGLGAFSISTATLFPDFYFSRVSWGHHPVLQVMGLLLHTLCLIGCLWSQKTMADSWRLPTVEVVQTRLIDSGPYSRVRHPIYLFVFGTNIGLMLCFPDAATCALVLLSAFVFRHFAILEEKWMIQSRDQEYRDFMAKVPRWGWGQRKNI